MICFSTTWCEVKIKDGSSVVITRLGKNEERKRRRRIKYYVYIMILVSIQSCFKVSSKVCNESQEDMNI